jgi:hypothetical protein
MSPPSGKHVAAAVVMSLVCLAAGAGLMALGVSRLRHGYRSRSWPTVPGVIRASEIRLGRTSGAERPSMDVHIEYEYTVGGERLVSDRAGFGSPLRVKGMRAMVDRYPAGARVSVAYDPADPRRAVLEPGIQNDVYWMLFVGALFVCSAGLIVYTFATGKVTVR